MIHWQASKKRSVGQEGMVLLVTLSALAFLVPLIYAGVDSQRFHMRRVEQELNLELAHRYAQSLLGLVVQILAKDGAMNSATDHLNEQWANPILLPKHDDGMTEALVMDNSRRWNFNSLKKQDGQINHELRLVLSRLFQKMELSSRLLDHIVEWLIPMDAQKVDPSPKEPLHAMEELLLLPDWNQESLRLIQPYLMIDEYCNNSRLNINTADFKILETIDPNQNWQKVMELRKKNPINQPADLANAGITLAPEYANLLTVNSTCFTAHIRSQVNTVTATLTVWMIRNNSQITITKMRWNG